MRGAQFYSYSPKLANKIGMKLYAPSRVSRRLGEKFFFKAIRDFTPKSAMIRRPYPPGLHGKRGARRSGSSEFGAELKEKQKVRYTYGVSDAMLKKYVRAAAKAKGKTKTQALFEKLEQRIDNVVFRLGLAASRRIARQLVNHRHISLNGKPIKTPSLLVKSGSKVSIREASRKFQVFEGLAIRLKKYQPPAWLNLNPEEWSGDVKRMPQENDDPTSHNLSKVIEFYSR